MFCSLEPLTSLPIEDSGPGVSPRDSAVMVRKCEYLRPWLDTYQSASLSRTASFLQGRAVVQLDLAGQLEDVLDADAERPPMV